LVFGSFLVDVACVLLGEERKVRRSWLSIF